MARGRFISKEIAIDKKVNSLSTPWSMLAFTWLLTHTDGYGRVYGDPAVVRSIVFPRRPDITVDEVEEFIKEWNSLGLINWYEVDDEMYIEFPNFSKHQVGLRIEKEGKSNIPPNPDNPAPNPENPEKPPENGGQIPDKGGKGTPEVEGNARELEGEFQGNVVVPNGDCGDLIEEFCTITGKEYPQGRKAETDWDYPLSQLKIKGATTGDVRTAIQELDAKNYPIVSPKSIVTACELVMGRRSRKTGESRRMDSNGQFAEYINH